TQLLAQLAPNVGTAANFALFTSVGEFENTGTTNVIGDIGNGAGLVTGDPVTVTGTTHFSDDVSTVAATDLALASAFLNGATCGTTLTTPIGAGAALPPGVYCSTTASVFSGQLTLDAGGNPNAVFIIKIGGALSVDVTAGIVLTGGAQLKNVYWQADGAFNLQAGANFMGTLINGGAINVGPGATVSGRLLSTAGKISLNSNNISSAEVDIALPVTLVSFTAKSTESQAAMLNWATTAETNSSRFEVEHSINGKIWSQRVTVLAKGESDQLVNYSYHDTQINEGLNYYRLKMIDTDETYSYSLIRSVSIPFANKMVMYPNPAIDLINLKVKDPGKVSRIQISDISGKLILNQNKTMVSEIPDHFNLQFFPSGLYVVRVTNTDGSFEQMRVVKK
ncbi:MAG TPA: ice-binding family protein, partial [Dyadobacter sp.]|nr:ice-binding family protein [Dyadobacter sp.]